MAKVPPTAGTGAAAGNPGRPTSLAVGGSSAGRPSFGGLRGDEGLRRGTFASLALACAALGYAEYSLLPEVGWFAAVVVVALAVIYRREGRVALLSIPDANRLGAGIAVLCAGWAAVRVIREYNRPEFTGLGWPLFFVCLCGMLILAVIPAKLLRRDKHAGDYWQLYLAGLGAAVLAGAMADDVFGFALLGAYAAAGVWALAEFHAARAAGRVPPVPSPGLPAVAPVVVRSAGGAPLPLSQPLVWAAVAVAAAGPLYLVTPRSEAGKLDFAKERVEIGFAADQMVDLTRTGDLKANPEEAFAVRVTDSAGRPVDDLDPGQRWRGVVLTHYRAGGWSRDDHLSLPPVQRTARNVRPWQPPDLGPDQLRVAFSVPTRLRAEFLADPVHWLANEPVPVADVTPGGPAGWYVLPDG
ncbi:MAG: DUF3488 domain-containing protein, partial [Gemmataceae bacterium]|nr:DUF3488 domain-containing protein [Gemmataceae bacterium]